MSIIKRIILSLIDLVKKSVFLSNLNEYELNGFINSFTKFRFLPYTKLTVPFSLGRTIRGVSFNKNFKLDPYGRLCIDISNGIENKLIFNELFKEFEKEKYLSAAHIVHLGNNANLKKYPAWAVVLPWEKINIEYKFDTYPEIFYQNRNSKLLNFKSRSRQSIINMMYSSESLENKIKQMTELYKSIKKNFIKKNINLPKINILIKGEEWRWFMGDAGNHRSYIFSIIGHDFFEARIDSIINKDDLVNWHNVKNGTYSISDAENIFESYFNGRNIMRGIV